MQEGYQIGYFDPKLSLEQKIVDGSTRYYQKFGRKPTLCHVNPAMIPNVNGNGIEIAGLTVKGNKWVSINYLKLGMKE